MGLGLGFGEMMLIFAVLLMLFGAKRLPELAQGMGRGIRDFKRAVNGLDEPSIQAGATQNAPRVSPPAESAQSTSPESQQTQL